MIRPKQARMRIARLGPGRDGAHLDKAEPQAGETARGDGVLIQPRGEADAVGEGKAHHGGAGVVLPSWPADGLAPTPHRRQGEAMRGFGG